MRPQKGSTVSIFRHDCEDSSTIQLFRVAFCPSMGTCASLPTRWPTIQRKVFISTSLSEKSSSAAIRHSLNLTASRSWESVVHCTQSPRNAMYASTLALTVPITCIGAQISLVKL